MTDTDDNPTDVDEAPADTVSSQNDTEPNETTAAESNNVADGRYTGMSGDDRSATEYLYWGVFAVLLVLALVAVVRFYFSASRAIEIWIASDYVPIFQSAFNLAVLFACGAGLSILVRRMND